MDYNQESLKIHEERKGKFEIKSKVPLTTKDELSIAYTPGVGAVCTAIGDDKNKSWQLTNRANQVAIVSDGTAILGLGDLGPEAAMPVMEGKAIIFKEFANIDAIPLCIDTIDPEEIIKFCKQIQPSFAGINLEDISAPRCFDITTRLEEELSIPVFHDDQTGTAIVTLAALMNACRVTGRETRDLKIIVNGAGAGGIATAELLISQGVRDLILLDSRGIISRDREDLNKNKQEILPRINKDSISGDLAKAMQGADVFVGLSKANLVSEEMVKSMNPDHIIFAMANPVPEIMPDVAIRAGASIVGTGRSDFANQINNALVFPGIFRGLFDHKKSKVTQEIKIATAKAVASCVEPSKEKILPDLTDKEIVKRIVESIGNIN